jgi:hypothetical protein
MDIQRDALVFGTAMILLELAKYRERHPHPAWKDFAERLHTMAREAQEIQNTLESDDHVLYADSR